MGVFTGFWKETPILGVWWYYYFYYFCCRKTLTNDGLHANITG